MANQINYQQLCVSCQEQLCSPFQNNFKKAQELGCEIVQKKLTSHMIDHYTKIQLQRTSAYSMRTDELSYTNFAKHKFILKEFASLVNDYKNFPCTTVFGGDYFEKVNLRNWAEFDITSFEDYGLDSDIGDGETSHCESPGINVFICTFWPFYRILRVQLLLYLLENLQKKVGCVKILYEKDYSLSPEIVGHSLCPVWATDKRYPSLAFSACNLRLCLTFVSCEAFACVTSWQDTADVLHLHLRDAYSGFVSPDLRNYYDVTSKEVPAKAKYGAGDAFRLFWARIRDIKSPRFLAAMVFLFIKKNKMDITSDMREKLFSSEMTFPLIQWVIMTRVSCGNENITHEHSIIESQRPFLDWTECKTDYSECKNDLMTFMRKNEQIYGRLGPREVIRVSSKIEHYTDSTAIYVKNKTAVQFQWILYDYDEDCLKGDAPSIGHCITALKKSEKWHHTMEDCFRHFYKTLIWSAERTKTIDSGELVIFVRRCGAPQGRA